MLWTKPLSTLILVLDNNPRPLLARSFDCVELHELSARFLRRIHATNENSATCKVQITEDGSHATFTSQTSACVYISKAFAQRERRELESWQAKSTPISRPPNARPDTSGGWRANA